MRTVLTLAVWSPLIGQVKVGNLSADLTGNLGGGYSGGFGNSVVSNHSWAFTGDANLAGSYYDPNFLSYQIQPFYNQSWANSDSQSILSSSGVNTGASIFGGSFYPGTVNYSRVYNSSGNFGVPGIANFTTHGNTDAFNVGWSENQPGVPHVSASYQQGSGDYSVYGANGQIANSYRGVNVNLNYQILGFTLTGGYRYQTTQLNSPEISGISTSEFTTSHSNSYSVGLGHKLPFHGSLSASANKSDFSEDYSGGNYNTTIETLNGGLNFNPIQHFNFGANVQYLDNLYGLLEQPLLSTSTVTPETSQPSSHSLDITGYGNYELPSLHLMMTATDEHRDQTWLGESLGSDSITGTMSYSKSLLGGFLNITGGATHTTVSPSNASHMGYFITGNYQRPWRGWTFAVSGNYTRSIETLLIDYTTSGYGYSGSASHKFSRTSVMTLAGSGSKSMVDQSGGGGSFAQTYSASYSIRKMAVSGAYSKSSGNAILTGAGLVPVSGITSVITPAGIVMYGGHAYSASVGSTPIKGLTASLSYSKAYADTQNGSSSSNNSTEQVNARIQYLVRKIYFQAGYLRLLQGFGGTGLNPVNVSSYYAGLTRWFSFF
jgi:hypothetical protein